MTKATTIHKEVKTICSGCEWNSIFEICCRMGQPCPHLDKTTCNMTANSITTIVPISAITVVDAIIGDSI